MVGELLTVKETAQILRVNPITVRRYVAAGLLGAVRVGRAIRIRRESLEDLARPLEASDEKVFTEDSALWQIVGTLDLGATDISVEKAKYLTKAYEAALE